MTTKDIIVNRDEENDVLYVIKRDFEKKNTVNISATSDIVIRLDPNTKKIVGLTIEEFSELFPDLADRKEYNLMEDFDTVIDFLNISHLIPR